MCIRDSTPARQIAASTYSAFPVCKKLIIVKAPFFFPDSFQLLYYYWRYLIGGRIAAGAIVRRLGNAPAVRRFPVKSIIAMDFDLGSWESLESFAKFS